MRKCRRQTDQHPRTVQADQMTGTQSQVFNHSAAGPNSAGMTEAVESSPVREADPSRDKSPPRSTPHKTSSEGTSRHCKTKWPSASDHADWQKLDVQLSQLLEPTLRGVKSKLKMFGEILFGECKERFGEVRKKQPIASGKGRRERDIEQLFRDRLQPRQNWQKAIPEEKDGSKVLWDELRQKLVRLRRVERIRKRRKIP